jgi:murein DD-endopeptidase MepM/ murein hydrolase activator NlpD
VKGGSTLFNKVKSIFQLKIPIKFIFIFIIVALVVNFALFNIDIRLLYPMKIDADIQKYKAEILELRENESNYKKEYAEILATRDKYKASIKELVDLLQNKNSFIGGFKENDQIGDSDSITLIHIRDVIQSMNDDQTILEEVKNYLIVRKNFIEGFPFIWPIGVEGCPYTSSPFGFRENKEIEEGKEGYNFHEGVDLCRKFGDDIVATANGIVVSISTTEAFGNMIILKHKSGFETRYAHLNKILVKEGEEVKREQCIGYLGNSGMSTGPHLHYEIRQNGLPIDPMLFLTLNY